MGSAEKSLTFAKFTVKPDNCKDKVTYKLTVPSDLAKLATAGKDGLSLKLKGTSTDAKLVKAPYTITLQAVGPSGANLANGSVTFKLTLVAAKPTTTTTGTTVKVPLKKPVKEGGKAIVEGLSHIVSIGASAVAAVSSAAAGAPRGPRGPRASGRGGMSRPGGRRPTGPKPPAGGKAAAAGGAKQGGGKKPAAPGGAKAEGSATFEGTSGADATVDANVSAETETGGADGAADFDAEESSNPDFAGVDFGL